MKLTKKQLLAIIFTGILLFILPVAIFLSQKRQEIRPKAQEMPLAPGSTLTFVGPNQVKVGEKFSVDVILDTTNDPDYTIANADAVVSVNPMGNNIPTPPTCRTDRTCPAYDLPLNFCPGGQIFYPPPANPCDCAPPPECAVPGEKQGTIQIGTSVSDPTSAFGVGSEGQYYPKPPYYNQAVTFQSVSPGKIFDNYNYPGLPGSTCGGFAGLKCPNGYYCSYGGANIGANIKGLYPDQSGTCISKYDDINPPPLVGFSGTGSSSAGGSGVSITGTVVDMSKLPSPNPAAECPPFPGCPPEGSLMPENICWKDQLANCPVSKPAAIVYGGRQIKIEGTRNMAVDEQGHFKGFTGKGTFATLNFVAQYPGKVTLDWGYIESDYGVNSSIMGYKKDDTGSQLKLSQRLRAPTQTFSVEVVSNQTCTPRPECMDSKGEVPPCLPPEPVGGWCNKEEVFTGKLDRLANFYNPSADVRQWGEFQITTSSNNDYGHPFPLGAIDQNVKAVRNGVLPINLEHAGDSKSVMQLRERMNKYVGQTVKLTGTLENLNLEGGFWGIWARDVETVTASDQCNGRPDGTDCGIGCENNPPCNDGGPCYACDSLPGTCQNNHCVERKCIPLNMDCGGKSLDECTATMGANPYGGWCPLTPTPHPGCYRKKEGDANCDGKIDGLDYSSWLNTQCTPGSNQKCGDTRGDFNGDGKVDDADYNTWFNNRGKINYLPD